MASKRGGLSKRELAAQSKAKAAPKVSSRSVSSKAPVATGPAIGPLMKGQIRSNSGPAIGPLLPNQTRATSSSSSSSSKSSSRDLASKAQSKNTSPSSSVQAAEASGLLGTQSRIPTGDTLKGGGGGIFDQIKSRGKGVMGNLMETFGKANGNRSLGMASDNAFLTDSQRQDNFNSLIGAKNAYASEDDGMSGLGRALQTASQPDIPTGYGDQGEVFYNNNEKMGPSLADFIEPNTGKMIGGQDTSRQNPFGIPTANAGELNYSPDYSPKDNRNYSSQNDTADSAQSRYEDMYGMPEAPTQEEITQQQNEMFGGGDMVDTAGGTVGNRSGRGSGNFGTGKGVMSDDPYIKELRKAYSSNGGEKWLRKQFEELISALDPTYAALQKEGTDAINAQLLNSNNQLASVMNANNTGDSEQRAQLMAQQQQGSQTALGNLLAKLSQSKAQDVSGYKSQQAEAMSKLQQSKQQDARTLLEKIQAYRGQQGQGQTSGRVAGPAKTPKLSRNDVFNWAEDALSKGYSWQEIADNAKEQGIGTETGGYLDQLMRNANNQNRFAR